MEEVEIERVFCSSPLWDLNKTWNVRESPDFTTCFHETVLEYIPLALLLILSTIDFYLQRTSFDRGIRPTVITFTRIGLNALAIIFPLIALIYNSTNGLFVDTASILSPVVRSLSYLFALALYLLNLKNGRVTSGPLFIYWLVEAVAGAFSISSIVNGDLGEKQGRAGSIIFIIEYGLVACILFLAFWADEAPEYKHMEGNLKIQPKNFLREGYVRRVIKLSISEDTVRLTPEKYASFPNRLVFGWFDRLAWKGWKTILRKDELWSIMHEFR